MVAPCNIDISPLKSIFQSAKEYWAQPAPDQAKVATNLKALHHPFGKKIGINNIELSKGSATLNITPAHDHTNTCKYVHGGFTSAVLDQVMHEAARTSANLNQDTVTSQLAIRYAEAIKPDVPIVVKARTLGDPEGDNVNVASIVMQDNRIKSYGVGRFTHKAVA